ncbi:hypothetical protein ROZALSC1DRAFT_25111, partial [Rozella allomycis CSF55]
DSHNRNAQRETRVRRSTAIVPNISSLAPSIPAAVSQDRRERSGAVDISVSELSDHLNSLLTLHNGANSMSYEEQSFPSFLDVSLDEYLFLIPMTVRAEHLFDDAFHEFNTIFAYLNKMHEEDYRIDSGIVLLYVTMYGENGIDHGGLSKSLISKLQREFVKRSILVLKRGFLTFNEDSAQGMEDFLAFVISLSLKYGIPFSHPLAPSLVRFLTSEENNAFDVLDAELPVVARTLKNMMKSTIETPQDYYMFFEDDGGNVQVNDSNKFEIIERHLRWIKQGATSVIHKHLFENLQKSFKSYCPTLYKELKWTEIQTALKAPLEIDVNKWQRITTYQDCDIQDNSVEYFWRVCKKFGYNLDYQGVEKTYPTVQSCFSILKLYRIPEYQEGDIEHEDYAVFKKKLLAVIEEENFSLC